MNKESLKWYRNNSDFTENSRKVNKAPILYFDAQVVTNGKYIFNLCNLIPRWIKCRCKK